jgi:hypothetical protein
VTLRIFETPYPTADDLYIYLSGQGYAGTLNDMMYQYLIDQGYTGSLGDMIPQAPSSPSSGSWILTTGFWDDTGEWDDSDIWND